MDLLTFTVEVTKALAWPCTVLVLALMLRKPIALLIPNTRRLKYKELEMEFSREIAELKADVSPKSTVQVSDQQAQSTTAVSRLVNLATYSARAAIIEAWVELESAAAAAAASLWTTPHTDVFKNYHQLGEYLLKCGLINPKQLETFNKLKELRNKAAHAEEMGLSNDDARSYVELASELASHIRKT